MTVKQLVEFVQQHHPNLGEAEIINRANRFLSSVARAYDIMKSTWSQDLVSGTRYYPLGDDIQDIEKVYINRVKVPRIEKLVIEDSDEPGGW